MSKNYDLVKGYYDTKTWSIDRVFAIVGKKLGITRKEYKDITGEDYQT